MSTSAAYRVFDLPELLRTILQCSQNNQHNILVCKTWSNEVLSIIWRCVDIIHLLRVLAPLEKPDKTFFFSRRLVPEDWERFHTYSWRVNRLENPISDSMTRFDDSVFSALSSTRPPRDLLPNLCALEYSCTPPAFLPMFLGANLTELSMLCECHYDIGLDETGSFPTLLDLAAAFTYLPAHSPRLECLDLLGDPPFEVLDCALQKILSPCALPKLKRLKLPFLHPTPVRSALSLPQLESLHVHADPQMSYIINDPVVPSGSSSSLRNFTITATLARAVLYLTKLSLPTLVYLKLDICSDDVGPDDYSRLLSILGVDRQHLETLIVACSRRYRSELISLRFSALQSILRLVNLKELRLDSHLLFDLDSDHVVSIVRALPSLTSLTLPNLIAPRTSRSSLDLSVFLKMIPYAQNLESLTLCVDARSEVPDLKERTMFPNLRYWDVVCSPASDSHAVAIYLSGILPSGCRIYHQHRGMDRNNGCWDKVIEVLHILQKVRQQERAMT